MKFWKIQLFLLVLIVIADIAYSRRYGGGSKSHSSGHSSGGGWSLFGKGSSKSSGSHSSAPTSFGKPPSHSSNGAPTSFGTSHSSPSISHDKKQQSSVSDSFHKSSAPVSHSDPYSRQPASNPSFNSKPYTPGGSAPIPAAPHGISAPYPHVPNHPHPSNIGSSSYPSASHYPSGPIQSHSYPNTHSSFPSNNGYHGSSFPQTGPSYPGVHSQPSYGGNAYHPQPNYASAPFVPGKTVIVMPQSSGKISSGPGIGSVIAGGVAGGVAAGATNAVVSHALSAIFRPSADHVHTYPSPPPAGTPTGGVTHITNNYYGNAQPGENGSSAGSPATPAPGSGDAAAPAQNGGPTPVQNNNGSGNTGGSTGAPASTNNNSPSGLATTNGVATKTGTDESTPAPVEGFVPDDEIMKLTEELFDRQDYNLFEHIEVNLQKKPDAVQKEKATDEASEPLFVIKPEVDANPTVTALKALYDNYERDGTKKEVVTSDRRAEEDKFLEIVAKSPVTTKMLGWLSEKKLIESDDFAQRDLMRRMWFSIFDETSSGFERIFLSERFGDSGIVGMQNWLYFAHLEAQNKVNYFGYVDHLNLAGKGMLLKMNYETEGFTMQNATIFVGTTPELEMSLYTVCYHARPNNWCPVSLGGAKFFILTHAFRYFGKDLIDLGFPAF